MKRLLLPLISIFLLTSCNNNQENKDIEFPTDAQWITDTTVLPAEDSLFYLDDPSPLFRKVFDAADNIKSARLLIAAAGYYRATINGERIGDHYLDPAWTNFAKRVYFSEYDLTDDIVNGKNCLGVTLGNGFYNPLPMKMWGGRNIRNDLPVGRPAFIASLVVEYENGETEVLNSDETWKFEFGPLMKNSVYLGEVYDGRNEILNWFYPDFDDESWKQAKTTAGPGGVLQKLFFPPIQITDRIEPIGIYPQGEGLFIADLGVNITGTYKIKLHGNPGDTIVFRFGERIYEDGSLNPMTTVCGQIKRPGVGGPGAPDIAWQTDSYIFGDKEEVWFSPEFTFHTYRYMEISGLNKMPQTSDIEAMAFNTNVARNSSFESSSQLLNSIQTAVERTFLDNLISVQSDCPAREKFGYGGDLNATSESFIYNYDMQAFYTKTIYDWVDAIRDSTFIDTAPFVGIKYCGLSWESAYLITQYYLYLYYNDTDLVKELYDFNVRWMEKAAMIHPDGIVDKGLSDHESLQPVPVKLTGTAHYMQCAEIMSEFAELMGDNEKSLEYSRLADKQRSYLKSEFWDKAAEGRINKQTLFATLLFHDIIPEDELSAAGDSLKAAVKNGIAGHFITGIFGTKYVLETMSEFVSVQDVFNIVNSTEFPGWGHMIDNGATTIWETWKESDNTFSNCHPMFGTVTEWYYRWLGGIRPDPEHPGFKEFIINPATPEGLDHVNCSYNSPHGRIVSNWKKEGEKTIFEITVPKGTTAHIKLPVGEYMVVEKDGKKVDSGEMSLKGGEYILKVINNK